MNIVDKYACLQKLKEQRIFKSSDRLDQGQTCASGIETITKVGKTKNYTAYTDACQVRDSKYF